MRHTALIHSVPPSLYCLFPMTGLGAKRTEAAERVVGELTKRDRQVVALAFEQAKRYGAHSLSIVSCKHGVKALVHFNLVPPPPPAKQQATGDGPTGGPHRPPPKPEEKGWYDTLFLLQSHSPTSPRFNPGLRSFFFRWRDGSASGGLPATG